MNNNYCVYLHITPDNMYYVGCSRNIKQRWHPSCYKDSKCFYPYVEQYGWDSIEHKIIKDSLTKEEALKLEDELIQHYRSTNQCINCERSGLISLDEKKYRKDLLIRNPEYHERRNEYTRRADKTEKVKKYRKEYRQRAEVKERRNKYFREYRRRKKKGCFSLVETAK